MKKSKLPEYLLTHYEALRCAMIRIASGVHETDNQKMTLEEVQKLAKFALKHTTATALTDRYENNFGKRSVRYVANDPVEAMERVIGIDPPKNRLG